MRNYANQLGRLLFLILLLGFVPALGQITHIADSSIQQCAGVQNCVVTFAPTNTGDLLILGGLCANQANVPAISVTDTGSSTWTFDVNVFHSGDTYYNYIVAKTLAVAAGVTTVTLRCAANGTGGSARISEFSWGGPTGLFDQCGGTPPTGCTENDGAANPAVTASLTPVVSGELAIGRFDDNGGNHAFTGTGGATCVNFGDTTNGEGEAICYAILSGTSANAMTATNVGGNWRTWQTMYKPGSASTTPGVTILPKTTVLSKTAVL